MSKDHDDLVKKGSPHAIDTTSLNRRRFDELHPKDQQIKQSKKLLIEKNWDCDIQYALPRNIRPRCESKKGSKARVSDGDVQDEAWWNWSVELLKTIEEISSLTVGDKDYACDLLRVEVEQRQENPKSTQRRILELLLGDAQRVLDDLKKQAKDHASRLLDVDDEDDAMDVYREGGHSSSTSQRTAHESFDIIDYDPPQSQSLRNGSAEHFTNMQHRRNGAHERSVPAHGLTIVDDLRMAELKARAARLRAKAVRCEAEAAQIELDAEELRQALNAETSME